MEKEVLVSLTHLFLFKFLRSLKNTYFLKQCVFKILFSCQVISICCNRAKIGPDDIRYTLLHRNWKIQRLNSTSEQLYTEYNTFHSK